MHPAGTIGDNGTTLQDGDAVAPRQRERRAFTWRTVVHGFLRSRRRDSRRADDGELLFSDWHHPWLFFLSTCIMIMSCLDAYLTLQLIELGAYEANPLMLYAMETDIRLFASSKMLLTALGVLMLVFLSRAPFMRFFRTGQLLTTIFALYASLVCYEFVYLLQLSL